MSADSNDRTDNAGWSQPDQDERWQDDPALRRTRREALMILCLWLCCFLWTTTYSYLNGYRTHEPLPPKKAAGPDIAKVVGPLKSLNRHPETLTYPLNLGIPDWVFWGVVVPWVICIVLSLAFCLFVFTEEDLSDPSEKEVETPS